MHIILIRHTESNKNIHNTFASDKNDEQITMQGRKEAELIGVNLGKFIICRNLDIKNIYSATSDRATQTAKIISQQIGVDVSLHENLQSIYSGVISGMSEKLVKERYPLFYYNLALYRTGLYNSYMLDRCDGEALRDFEKRVRESINEIISIKNESIKIIVAHRSTITATLIDFARKYHGYPQDFYGYIQLNLGCLSHIEKENGKDWNINEVNIQSDILLET